MKYDGIADAMTMALGKEWGRARLAPEWSGSALAAMHRRCGAIRVVAIDRAAEYGDSAAFVRMIDAFTCYCVAPPPAPCEPVCGGRRCADWSVAR